MARGVRSGRKPASDSTTGQIAAAQRADLSAVTAPREITGADSLNEVGLKLYDALFRSRHEWTQGDLLLIVSAAQCGQAITELSALLAAEGMKLTNPVSGAQRINPALAALSGQRTEMARLLRDAGLRTRDGKDINQGSTPLPEPYKPAPSADAPAPVSFEKYLEDLMK